MLIKKSTSISVESSISGYRLNTPIAFFVFNRPETTQQIFEEIRKAKPSKLLVVADGPRITSPGEAEKCAEVRAIIDQVDWNCDVLKKYSNVNLGCKERLSSGLEWVFKIVEEAIILEDDCLPHPTFFRFCQELLKRYRDDERIMAISGDNFQSGLKRTEYSYYFSRYIHCWGWASWKRAWQNYDISMKLWPEIRDGEWLKDILHDNSAVKYWKNIFELTYKGLINTWDYQWTFACWIKGGLSIIPNVNLISNIGFGKDATHTKQTSRFSNMTIKAISFPLCHPPFVIRDARADNFTQKNHYSFTKFFQWTKFKPKKILANLRIIKLI